MGRAILGGIIGYVVMSVVVMAAMLAAWSVLGPEGSFIDGGPEPTTAWVVSALVAGFIAAFAGGWIAFKLGRRQPLAVKILVGVILVAGLFFALTAETSYENRRKKAEEAQVLAKETDDLTLMDASLVAKNPTWFNWVIPLVGVAGALLGGRERGKRLEV